VAVMVEATTPLTDQQRQGIIVGRIHPTYLRQLCEVGLSPGRARQVRSRRPVRATVGVGGGADGLGGSVGGPSLACRGRS
jgi:hypothetical protein